MFGCSGTHWNTIRFIFDFQSEKMDQHISIQLSMDDLKTLIKDLISEYLLEYSEKSKNTKSDLLSYAQAFEKFYVKPHLLEEWKEAGLINEYPVGKTVKFKISELFRAMQQFAKEYKEEKERELKKEVTNG